MMRVLLKNNLSPGDILMITSAVRDLYKSCKNQLQIGVQTTAMSIWDNNPYVDFSINENNADKVITVHYDYIHKSNFTPIHFMNAVRINLQQQLGVKIQQGQFKCDIHLSQQEKNQKNLVQRITGQDKPFWIIDAGCKHDVTNKMWQFDRFQQVVDQLKDQVFFVQIGEQNPRHFHKPLKNVLNLIGKTQHTRQFIKLMYHASGVLTPVSFPMHLSTMCGRKDRILKSRPCVVIAGGRQPSQWQAYTNHAYIHRCGRLPCCDYGGCWKARIQPLNDGQGWDRSMCIFPVKSKSGQKIPLCMNSITVQQVVKQIRRFNASFQMAQDLFKVKDLKDASKVSGVVQKYLNIYS